MMITGQAIAPYLDNFMHITPLIVALTLTHEVCDWRKNVYIPANEEAFDYIIVGAGSAGSVVAGRLSEVENWNVLVIEAGDTPHPSLYVPRLSTSFTGIGKSVDWGYKEQRHEGLSSYYYGNSPSYGRGKIVGGCGSINGMHIQRGNKRDFDKWESFGNPGWGYNDVLPYFKRFETYIGPNLTEEEAFYHGFDGPLPHTYREKFNDFQLTSFEAAKELGYEKVDYNGAHQVGISETPHSYHNGERVSTADAYIRPYLGKRDNLKLFPNALVTKILLNETNTATGIEYQYNGEIKTAYARKEVILSAGAVNSPQLLMLSGIGPEEELSKHDINTIVNVPGVGKNMNDHVSVGLTFLKGNITNTIESLANSDSIKEYLENRTGPYAERTGEEGAFLVNLEGDDEQWADVSLHMNWFGGNIFGNASTYFTKSMQPEFAEYFSGWEIGQTFTMNVVLLRQYSRGQILLASNNALDAPILDLKLLTDERDVKLLVKGIKFAIEFSNQNAFRKRGVSFYEKHVPGCTHITDANSDEYYECLAKVFASPYAHMAGTCKMGPDSDQMTVVDKKLRVRGVKNLRVVDASIMPDVITGHTYAATVMIGEKASDMIKEHNQET